MNTDLQKIIIPENSFVVQHDTKNLQNTGTIDWYLEPYATLRLVDEYSIHEDVPQIRAMRFFLGHGSSLEYFPIIGCNGMRELSITINLAENAQATVQGVYVLKNQERCDIKTRQYHHGKQAVSNLAFNGIAIDQSMITYAGTIAVEKNAVKTTASQENKTILWGPHAKAISVPALEVQTNDVQCAHGSAVGPLNAEHIRYVQSRGLSRDQAQRLLLGSFFAETLDTLAQDVRARIITKLIAYALDS